MAKKTKFRNKWGLSDDLWKAVRIVAASESYDEAKKRRLLREAIRGPMGFSPEQAEAIALDALGDYRAEADALPLSFHFSSCENAEGKRLLTITGGGNSLSLSFSGNEEVRYLYQTLRGLGPFSSGVRMRSQEDGTPRCEITNFLGRTSIHSLPPEKAFDHTARRKDFLRAMELGLAIPLLLE